ncbi:MAG: cytochrome c oxidase assembly protein [Actinomycetota bacterium]|nr:MAG: cytochrome c oxidase assembly protein [Actinomycetota bacterium]
MLAAVPYPDPWRFQAHVEVWLLTIFLVLAYVYVVKVLGPRVVGPGATVVTGRQKLAFAAGILTLWLASDWPVHDVAEEYLYSVHMVQHMALTYFMPPLVLLATPEWFARLLIGEGRVYRAVMTLSRPIVAAVLFNVGVMVSHVPGVVNTSVSNGPLHYMVHVLLVMTALAMWMPVCGPLPEAHIGPMAKMVYLFANSVVAIIPAAWLTFAEGAVYSEYDQPVRVWGLSITDDQQLAGAIMKAGGSIFLWTIIVVLFVRRFGRPFREENAHSLRREPTRELEHSA